MVYSVPSDWKPPPLSIDLGELPHLHFATNSNLRTELSSHDGIIRLAHIVTEFYTAWFVETSSSCILGPRWPTLVYVPSFRLGVDSCKVASRRGRIGLTSRSEAQWLRGTKQHALLLVYWLRSCDSFSQRVQKQGTESGCRYI